MRGNARAAQMREPCVIPPRPFSLPVAHFAPTVGTAMSSLSSFLPSRFLSSMHNNPRDRQTDPLSRLRFTLETMPGSRKYVFTPATRAEILSELYDAFWGPYAHLFLPNSSTNLPWNTTLSEAQARSWTYDEQTVTPGRPCGRIFKKGEACFRCKCVFMYRLTCTLGLLSAV